MIPRRRFWREVAVLPVPDGFAVALDGRPLRIPAAAALRVPTRAFAEAIAAEWRAVEGEIRPERLPFTRAANAAIDRVAPDPGPVVAHVAGYGASDLLCYRAEGPEALRRRQDAAWDPPLAWAAATLGAPLVVVSGVIHRDQPPASLAALREAVAAEEPFALAALHELATLSGSLVLGLAVSRRALDAADAWERSRLDEAWQAELWGEDAEAAAAAEGRRAAFLDAARMLDLLSDR